MKRLKNILFTFLALGVSFGMIVTVNAEETTQKDDPNNQATENNNPTENEGQTDNTENPADKAEEAIHEISAGDVVITSEKTDFTGVTLTMKDVASSDYSGLGDEMGLNSCQSILAVYRITLTKDGVPFTTAADDVLNIAIKVSPDLASDNYYLFTVNTETGAKPAMEYKMENGILSFTNNKLSDYIFVGSNNSCDPNGYGTLIETTTPDGTEITFGSKKDDLAGLSLDVIDLISEEAYTEEEMNAWVNKDQKVVGFYDIKVSDGVNVQTLPEGEYQVKVKLPEGSEEYKYYRVGYVKDGEKTIDSYYDATMDEDGYIVFNTTHLSQYVVMGSNTAFVAEGAGTTNEVKAPDTFDGVGTYITFGLISLIAVGITCGYLKKKVNEM